MTAATLARLLYLMAPIILAGICNMAYVKLPLHGRLRVPMDGGRRWRDGARIFGDNKTWKGFLGMIAFASVWFSLQAALDATLPGARALSLVPFASFPPRLVPVLGALWGLGYVLAELPNSFMKRRLGVRPGANVPGLRGALFLLIDQGDSVLGCLVALRLFYPCGWRTGLLLLLIGTGVHLAVNAVLYLVGLRKQAA